MVLDYYDIFFRDLTNSLNEPFCYGNNKMFSPANKTAIYDLKNYWLKTPNS